MFATSLVLTGCFGLVPHDMPWSTTPVAAAENSGLAVDAVRSAIGGDFFNAPQLASRSGDQAAIKLVELLYLKDQGKDASYSRIMAFLQSSPNWPLSETFLKNAEGALFHSPRDTDVVIAHFAARKPLTAEGMFALARARLQSGDKNGGRTMLQQAWLNTDFSLDVEKQALSEFGGQLSGQDHKNRMWRLVFAQQPNAAIRQSKRIGGAYPAAAVAAQYLIGGAAGAERKLAALPGSLRNAPALQYALARYYRRLERFGKARAVLANMPGNGVLDAEAVWTERRIIARRSVGPKLREHWNAAYAIASNHGLLSGTEAVEAEFLSGWIALRYKKDASLALKHFSKLKELAPTRTEKARAYYWTGRAELALQDRAAAKSAFAVASDFGTIFYGQLAREHVGLANTPATIDNTNVSNDALERVSGDEVVRAFRLVQKTGNKDHLNQFLWSLAKRFKSKADMNAVASIVHDAGGLNMALRFAKAAGQAGVDIDGWGYPVRGLPNWKQIGKSVEKPLVFALSRQESEFNAQAGSSAGAQGLMQLMPGTARIIAKQNGMSFAVSKLKSDPAYNVKLGAAHLADLVAEYRGSYILTLVAYNAGPRRVTEWIAAYGDPRSAAIDPIDWVESIPFHETRQYVQKVLQNVHIYRSRLAPRTVTAMSKDLKRGGAQGLTVASTSTVEPTACGGSTISALVSACD